MPRLIFLLALLLASGPSAWAADNLVRNPSFEQLAAGEPISWWFESFSGDQRNAEMTTSSDAHGGRHAMRVRAERPDDVKLMQHVPVEPSAVYRISAWVKTIGVGTDQLGANLSIRDITDTSPDVRGTSGDWVPLELYGRTGQQQRSMALTLRLGGYGRVNHGEALFDDVSVVRIDQPPSGARLVDLFQPEPADDQSAVDPSEMRWTASASAWALGGAATFAALAFYLSGLFRLRRPEILASGRSLPAPVWGLLLVAVALRVWLVIASPGLPNDIGAFAAWAQHAASHGLFWSYSDPSYFLDYPPGYLYVLFLIGTLSEPWPCSPTVRRSLRC